MRASVRKAFVRFTSDFEGVVSCMYADRLGFITVAIGNLCDSIDAACALPFLRADGTPASRQEIADEWQMMHDNRAELAHLGWKGAFKIATLHLSPAGIDQVVTGKLVEVDAFLGQRFPGYEGWPAAGQLLVLSMSWAMGGHFNYPAFSAAVNGLDFATAANECWIGPRLIAVREDHGVAHARPAPPGTPIDQLVPDPKNPGVHPRNLANVKLALEAEAVLEAGLDMGILHYPGSVVAEQPVAAGEEGPAGDGDVGPA